MPCVYIWLQWDIHNVIKTYYEKNYILELSCIIYWIIQDHDSGNYTHTHSLTCFEQDMNLAQGTKQMTLTLTNSELHIDQHHHHQHDH